MEDTLARVWDKFWHDKRGRLIIWQTPNLVLIAWVILTILSLVTGGGLSDIFYWTGTASLVVWAALEITLGVNYFRRTLGLVVLILAVASGINSL